MKVTNLFLTLIINGLAVYTAAYILSGVTIDSSTAALITAIILGVVNALIKPVLLILTLPINLMSFGLFTLVINASLILLAAWLVPGFTVQGIGWALLFSILLTIINWFFNRFLN